MIDLYRRRYEHYGHGRADQAIVGIGGHAFMAPKSQDAIAQFRPYFTNAPVYGHGPSMEDFMRSTPRTVGSPQEVIDRYAQMRDSYGNIQRRMFLIDHAGLPTEIVLEQIDMLGRIVAPALREVYDTARPADVPDAPTHAARLAERNASSMNAGEDPHSDAYRFETGDNWTGLRAEDNRRAGE